MDLEDEIENLLEGKDLDEVIRVLAYALADSVAYATDYTYDATNNANLAEMVQDAYKFCCTENSVTVN
jgi:hypothetical protein